jgi:hypothetical protein
MSDFDYDSFSGGVEMFGSAKGFNLSLTPISNRWMYSQIRYDVLPMHGSPQDRGSADRYYGRPYSPHFWPEGTSHGTMVRSFEMSDTEIAAYKYGWDNEDDRKDWG